MIILTKLGGDKEAINEDLIERIEGGPNTRVHLSTGTNYVVAETVDEIIRLCQLNEAEVHVLARRLYGQARRIDIDTVAEPPESLEGEGAVLPFSSRSSATGHLPPAR